MYILRCHFVHSCYLLAVTSIVYYAVTYVMAMVYAMCPDSLLSRMSHSLSCCRVAGCMYICTMQANHIKVTYCRIFLQIVQHSSLSVQHNDSLCLFKISNIYLERTVYGRECAMGMITISKWSHVIVHNVALNQVLGDINTKATK